MQATKDSASAAAVAKAARGEDARLVEAVLRKDRKATAEFVACYLDGLYAYLRRRLVPRVDLVDDLLQEVFLAALENLAGFQGRSSLKAWLLGIARHKVEDYYRSRLRDDEPLDEESNTRATVAAAFEPKFDQVLDRQRLENRTREVLESLPEAYSVALLWRYWEKRSAREMARQAGKTEKVIERLLARARLQFKRRWNER